MRPHPSIIDPGYLASVDMNLSNEYVDRTHRTCLFIIAVSMYMLAACQQEPANRSMPAQGDLVVDTLVAVEDFNRIEVEGYAPYYRDEAREVLAVNSVEYPDEFGAAETEWDGPAGTYDVTIETMPEEDGECTYRLFVDGALVGEFVNPETDEAFGHAAHTWTGVEIDTGDTIRVSSNTHSNELVPENDGYAWARGRWTQLVFERVQ